MKGFNRKEGLLFIDDISLKDIAKKFGTPVYVYSASKLKENLNNYLSSVRKEDKICYSVKSNSIFIFFHYFQDSVVVSMLFRATSLEGAWKLVQNLKILFFLV